MHPLPTRCPRLPLCSQPHGIREKSPFPCAVYLPGIEISRQAPPHTVGYVSSMVREEMSHVRPLKAGKGPSRSWKRSSACREGKAPVEVGNATAPAQNKQMGGLIITQTRTPKMAIRFLLWLMVLLVGTGGPMALCSAQKSKACHFPAIFNLGDSNSDTGALVASALGLDTPLPYGRSFFHRNAGRFSDGRLIIDFLCEALGLPFLSPYLQAAGADFRHGANFAFSATTIVTPNTTDIPPFSFPIQVNQLKRFKARILDILSSQDKSHAEFLPPPDSVGKALYTFDMGQNDVDLAFAANLTQQQVNAYIPQIIEEFASDLKSLYEEGGRYFWVHNTGPLGCLPRILANIRSDLSKLDQHGCGVAYNEAAQTFNVQLHNALRQLRKELSNATIVYVDVYSIKYDLIANATKYGFEHPLTACCGYGGLPYNFNNDVRCAATGRINGTLVRAGACKEGSKYVNWDGTHYTEAANYHVSTRLLCGNFSEPPLAPNQVCHASI